MILTKIIATVGLASDTVEKMVQLIEGGVSVFRFNLKHNTQRWHSVRIARANKAARKVGKSGGYFS